MDDFNYIESWNVANKPNTPPETLDRLANDENFGVRANVAINRNTLPETLARLANDKFWIVRYNVARNLNAPQYVKDYIKIKEFLKSQKL